MLGQPVPECVSLLDDLPGKVLQGAPCRRARQVIVRERKARVGLNRTLQVFHGIEEAPHPEAPLALEVGLERVE